VPPRVPPFQPGETEKGFRDAMVLESFLQLVADSPRNPAVCRVALVTKDERLTAAAVSRISEYGNAEVLDGLDDLRNLINTLVSTVDEEFVKELREKAQKVFFIPKDDDTFYYREKVGNQIREKFSKDLEALPQGTDSRQAGKVLIGSPQFIRKERQRVHWVTTIEFHSSFYKQVEPPSANTLITGTGTDYITRGLFQQPSHAPLQAGGEQPTLWRGLLSGLDKEKVLVKNGHADFTVAWSTTLDKNKRLTRAQIDNIAFAGMVWE
jgi:hypothetical protein